ncbi:two-partner secretion domain-containing protein [Allocoleopsis franciscana]|uniref:Filamentous hemagglutinin family N-terminal domain protein n=1 Tax=Allocoleopsis franciscana PCC 7113 TaxID=1173027 RepID=K9WJA6_9CYAN|nr:filamentous hemagglutinin N-terminal domain-containing protein [Allocoleopsis franciscana]AFZ20273.1 filamentous hemagglutinin family N-terminal domain protein [Allocoleopsis franciscana PCC 7113]
MPEIRQALNRCSLRFASGRGWQRGLVGCLVVGWVYSFSGNRATAQITPDATLGVERSVVRANANIRGQTADLIEGGAARGANLFHSFQEFNVGDGQQVYFANPVGIENILTRVTGNTLSNIRGTLGVDGGANLFLLNPNGMIFGPNAKLDIPGSFVASTAKSLVFENGVELSATNPQAPPLLTISITPGVQYGSNQPGSKITNVGKLAVGHNLTLAADTLDLQGQLSAGGDLTLKATDTVRVQDSVANPFIASAGGQLLVQGDRIVDIFALNHPTSVFSSGGDIVWRSANTIGGDARVRAGRNFRIEQLDGSFGNLSSPKDPVFEVAGDFSLANYTGASLQILAGGSVNISGNVTINGFGGAFNDSSVTLSDGTTVALNGTTRPTLDIRAGTTGFSSIPTPGTPTSADISIGSITMRAPDGVVFLTNQYAPNTLLTGGAIAVGTIRTDDTFGGFVGNSGSVIIDSRRGLTVNNRIDSSSATGNAGDIRLITSDVISLVNSVVTSDTSGLGKGGDIDIKARQLLVSDGASIIVSTFGEGDGGSLTVNATESVQVIGTSVNGQTRSGLLAQTVEDSTGNAGNVTINTPVLLILGGARVSASTFSSGDGGNLTINATESVQVLGRTADDESPSGLFALASGDSTGKAGNLTINTPQLLVSGGGWVSVSTFSSGNGGNLTVNATGSVQVVGRSANDESPSALFALASEDSTGKAGNLTINTPQLLVTDGAEVSTNTFGSGDGGNLLVNATESVQLVGTSADGQSVSRLSVDTQGTGKGGNLTITTPVLLVSDGAQVSAGTLSRGDGGNLTVNASSLVQLIGRSADSQFASAIYAQAERDSTGKAGDLTITTPVLLLSEGAEVSATTFGAGDGGNLLINASSLVQLIGRSVEGQASSRIVARSQRNSTGKAGNLTITTPVLLVSEGAQISATTFGSGDGGDLTINASSRVQVSGRSADGEVPSGLFAQAERDSTGKGGNLTINTGRLVVENGGQVSASGTGAGIAGNLDITADSIFLSNQGGLRATTAAVEGGNIRLKVADSLILRNNSEIVASATGTANGGNINVEAGSYIVGILKENSDIVADADRGQGGRITAKAPGIFGFRKFIDRRTPESDFSANSAVGLDGSVELNTQDKLEDQLPTNFVDGTQLIDRRCTPPKTGQERSSFTITGRGGLPPSPNDTLQGESIITNWVTLDSNVENKTPPATSTPQNSAPKQLVEAQGWYFNPKGEVVLTASAPTITSPGKWLPEASCNAPSARGQ